MKLQFRLTAACLLLAGVLSACADSEQTTPSSTPEAVQSDKRLAYTCPANLNSSFRELENLLSNQVFASSSTRGEVQSLYNDMKRTLTRDNDPALAEQKLNQIINITLAAYSNGGILAGALTGNPSKLTRFMQLLYEVNCIDPSLIPNLPAGGGSALIFPTSNNTVVTSQDKQASVVVPAGAVPDAYGDGVFIVVYPAPTNDTLPTNLDKYGPTYIVHDEPDVNQYDLLLTVGVCVDPATVPAGIFDRLRLAHGVATPPYPALGNIEISDLASASEVAELGSDCGFVFGMKLDRSPMKRLMDFMLPQPLFAAAGGFTIGGKYTNLSPFQAVDPVLLTSALSPATQTGTVGQPVASPPSVQVATANGTEFASIDVAFATDIGSITQDPDGKTNADGIATAGQWVLALGLNTATATFPAPTKFNPGGKYDGALYATFTPASQTFQATGSYPPLTLSPATLPTGDVNVAYSQTLTAGGGSGGPYTITQTGGSLPQGITFTPGGTTATVSGTPTQYGEFTFEVTASDGVSPPLVRSYTLSVPVITALFVVWTENPVNKQTCNVGLKVNPTVRVTDQDGRVRSGITVTLAARDNNGVPADIRTTTPTLTNSLGLAFLKTWYVTKSGGYDLYATASSGAISSQAVMSGQRINVGTCK